jgi:GT2 family glycosyltransferase
VSVVVAVRNGLPWLTDQLTSLIAQETADAWEVLVCDNGSTDETAETVRAIARSTVVPTIRLLDASARRGPAAARNAGVRSAANELIAFCDADDVVEPGWLEAMRAALEGADVVAGSFEMGTLNGSKRSAPQPAVTKQLGQLPAGLAANLGVHKSAFESVGGFDEEFQVGEDIDLCWRMQLAGFRFAVAERAVVAKRERTTGAESFRQGVAHGKSGPRLYRRHKGAGIKPNLRAAGIAWGWLIVNAVRLYRPEDRKRWLRVAGVRIGRILGSIQSRVFFP